MRCVCRGRVWLLLLGPALANAHGVFARRDLVCSIRRRCSSRTTRPASWSHWPARLLPSFLPERASSPVPPIMTSSEPPKRLKAKEIATQATTSLATSAPLPPPPPPADPCAGVNALKSGRGTQLRSPAAAQLMAALSLFDDQPGSTGDAAAAPGPASGSNGGAGAAVPGLPTGACWPLVSLVTPNGLQTHAGGQKVAALPVQCLRFAAGSKTPYPSSPLQPSTQHAPPNPALQWHPAQRWHPATCVVSASCCSAVPALPIDLPRLQHLSAVLASIHPNQHPPACPPAQTRSAWRPASGAPARSDAGSRFASASVCNQAEAGCTQNKQGLLRTCIWVLHVSMHRCKTAKWLVIAAAACRRRPSHRRCCTAAHSRSRLGQRHRRSCGAGAAALYRRTLSRRRSAAGASRTRRTAACRGHSRQQQGRDQSCRTTSRGCSWGSRYAGGRCPAWCVDTSQRQVLPQVLPA